ncbi:hypothetical protein FGO68_gene4537 [Halteria grandinella]|uniref:Uncharacterized protein n=1 Tax=Halteria grandinella TaxID=5974 RepID=A0A8J8NKA0_HALGN|nr:hypothetical protein FGO68_gene4537 [Halteria grandinella]
MIAINSIITFLIVIIYDLLIKDFNLLPQFLILYYSLSCSLLFLSLQLHLLFTKDIQNHKKYKDRLLNETIQAKHNQQVHAK